MNTAIRPSMRAGSRKPNDWFRIENLHVDKNQSTDTKAVIYIYDEIGDSWWGDSTDASSFVKQVAGLTVDKIDLHLNSPGGDIFDGIAIYQILKSHDAEVTVYVDALAASAASFIAQAGDKIIMTSAATMMIHDGSAMAWGTAADMHSMGDVLDKLSNTVAGIYADRAGQTKEFWRAEMVKELWLNAEEAVEFGLADEIGGQTDDEDLKVKNKWDLSIFNHAGRENAPDPRIKRLAIANEFIEENSMTDDDTTSSTGSPDTDPDTQTTSPPAEQPTPASEPETQPEADPQPAAPSAPTAPEGTPPGNTPSPDNKLYTFMVSGSPVQMTMAQAQAQLTELTEFRNQSITAGKKAFVKALHDEKKITGPQVKAIEDYVMSLPDEQYDAYRATWEGAGSVPMLGNHAVQDASKDGAGARSETDATELETAKEIVNNFKRSNMPQDTIKETPSYKRLMELDPTFKL